MKLNTKTWYAESVLQGVVLRKEKQTGRSSVQLRVLRPMIPFLNILCLSWKFSTLLWEYFFLYEMKNLKISSLFEWNELIYFSFWINEGRNVRFRLLSKFYHLWPISYGNKKKKLSDVFYIWTSASLDSPFYDKNSRYKNHYEKSWRKFVEQLIQQLRRGLNRIMIKFMIASSQNGPEYEVPDPTWSVCSF